MTHVLIMILFYTGQPLITIDVDFSSFDNCEAVRKDIGKQAAALRTPMYVMLQGCYKK